MRVKVLLALGLGASLCNACGDSDEKTSSGPPEAAFLSSEELSKPSDTTAVAPADLNDLLQSKLDIFQPTSGGSTTLALAEEDDPSFEKFQECTKGLLDQTRIKASGEVLSYGANLDFTSCFSASPQTANGANIVFKEYTLAIFFSLGCDGSDLAKFDGVSWSEFIEGNMGDEPLCSVGGSLLSNIRTVTIQELVSNDSTVVATVKNFGATSTSLPDGSACKVTLEGGTYSYSDGCRTIEITSSTGGDTSQVDYIKQELGDVTWKKSTETTWFDSGTMAVDINNWSGNVVFTGSEIAPTYEFSNGTETIKGTLGFDFIGRRSARPFVW